MKDSNNIDEIFQSGTEHQYPFDENLWSAVQGQLPSKSSTVGLWMFNLNSIGLLIILFICAIIPTDNTKADKLSYIPKKTNSLNSIKNPSTLITNSNSNTQPNKSDDIQKPDSKVKSKEIIQNNPIETDRDGTESNIANNKHDPSLLKLNDKLEKSLLTDNQQTGSLEKKYDHKQSSYIPNLTV